jgi:cathepsin B
MALAGRERRRGAFWPSSTAPHGANPATGIRDAAFPTRSQMLSYSRLPPQVRKPSPTPHKMKASLYALASVAAAAPSRMLAPELAERRAIDDSLITAIKASGATWEAGLNERFEGVTLGEAARLMGTVVDQKDPYKRAMKANSRIFGGSPAPITGAAPASFDSRTAWPQCAPVIGHIRDQSDCGCCWAFGSTEAVNDRQCIVHGLMTLLSPQDMCSCCDSNQGCMSGGCDGGWIEDAWSYAQNYGLVSGRDYDGVGAGDSCFPYQLPFCSHHEPGKYANCSSTEYSTPACPIESGKGCSEAAYGKSWAADKVKAASGYALTSVAAAQADIAARGPISATFTVYQDFLT